jgi:predicted permease
LFLRSFVKLVTLDIGFDRNNVLLVNANLKTAGVPQDRYLATFEDIENRLRSLPGVVSAGRSVLTPISGFEWNNIVQVDSPNAPKGDDALVDFNFVSPGYFQTLRTPILAGRGFDARDTKTSPQVAIVNQTMVKKFFQGTNPAGKYFKVDAPKPGQPPVVIQIVGIIKDSKYESLRDETPPTAFFPITQIPDLDDSATFELRSTTPPVALISAVQESIAIVNKEIPLEFRTLAKQVDDSLVQERLLATLSGFFGGLALLLAMIGLYGALSYAVTLRRTEFGIRMALGALPGSILSIVMKDVAVVLSAGLLAGATLSFLAVRLLQKLLFGLTARDPLTIATAIGILTAVALLAAYLPARRAMRVDPMVALRYE